MPGLAPGIFIWKTLSKTEIIPAYKKTTREEFDMARVALVTGNAGHWRGDQQGDEGRRLQGRRQLCRQ
jgi:hypothetical protein